MKKSLVFIFCLLSAGLTYGQRYKTIELKPISKQGWKYAYDLKSVSSPAALEVPLIAVNDAEVNRYFKASKTWRTVGSVVTVIPFIYIISLSNNVSINQSTFWWVIGSTVLAQIGFEAVSHAKLGMAIDRYNYVIMQPSGNSLGLELTWKFR
ncbi:MAG: hypothetical protein JNK10_07435 [Cyclobacteriaceae bacterium]|nr:hypothetical protein [Cyclobacteriaceae bacterium]